MKRYTQITDTPLKEALMARITNNLNAWIGEIGKSRPKVIPKRSLIKTIDSYKENGKIIRVIEYKNELYYATENSYMDAL